MIEVSFAEADSQIRSAWKVESGRNRRSMVIGWHAYRLKKKDQWQSNGYADEAAYRDAVGISSVTWGRMTRIAGTLAKLDVQEFTSMTAENAEHLGSLPNECKYSLEWRTWAQRELAEVFRKRVLTYKAAAAGLDVPDMRVKLGFRLFESQRTVIKTALSEFQKENAISDEGTALEWLCMEYHGRKTFARFIREEIPKLKAALVVGGHFCTQREVEDHILALVDMLNNLKHDQKG